MEGHVLGGTDASPLELSENGCVAAGDGFVDPLHHQPNLRVEEATLGEVGQDDDYSEDSFVERDA